MTVQLSASTVSEGALTQPTVNISRAGSLSSPLTVSLSTSNAAAVVVPASAVIAANQTSVTVAVELVNNGDIDNARTATITAGAVGYTSGAAVMQVANDDTPQLRTLGGPLSGTLVENVYVVTRTVTVLPASAWTIAPGAALRFNSGTQLLVQGVLTAQGSAAKSIEFTSSAASPAPGSWNGIRFDNPDQTVSQVTYAEIAYATTGVLVQLGGNGAPSVTLRQSEIHHHRDQGVNVDMSTSDNASPTTVQFIGNHIHHNGGAGIEATSFSSGCSSSNSSPLISQNEINANGGAGIYLVASRSSTIYCVPSRTATTAPEILGNNIHHNQIGISGRSARGAGSGNATMLRPTIQNNIVATNVSHGIHLTTASSSAGFAPELINNTVADNGGTGILHAGAFASSGIRLVNSAVTGNQRGIAAEAAWTPAANVVEFNNVFGNSAGNWSGYPAAFGAPSGANANGTPADAEQNISAAPQYVGGGDYRLQPVSLMIGAGTTSGAPSTDRQQEPRFGLPDIGMDEVTPLTLMFNTASISEVGGVATATIRRSSSAGAPLVVLLTSSDATEATVQSSITIPAGQNTATFPVRGVEDRIRDGNQTATITASSAGHFPSTAAIQVVDHNYPPSDITLPVRSVAEDIDNRNGPVAVSVIRATDDDPAAQLQFSLAPGGDSDFFQIQGDVLQIRQGVVVDFETKPRFEISLQVFDGEHALVRPFTISVLDRNEPPSNLTLATNPLEENTDTQAGSLLVGVLSATDQDSPELAFQLVSGEGDDDNASFLISQGELRLRQHALLDFETKPSYQVRIEVSDGQLRQAEMFVVQVIDVNEAPTDLRLLQSIVIEDQPGAVVGPLIVDDPDRDEFFTWVISDDRFEIAGGELKLKSGIALDFETETDVTLQIAATDSGGLTIQRELTVEVNDAIEPVHPWHNAVMPLDVNADDDIDIGDLIAIVARLRQHGSPHALPAEFTAADRPPPFVDVNADDQASLADLLAVLHHLREMSDEPDSETEQSGLPSNPRCTVSSNPCGSHYSSGKR